MRIGLELEGDVVRIVLMADDEQAAERHYEMLEQQLASGRIEFGFRDYRGQPPRLEQVWQDTHDRTALVATSLPADVLETIRVAVDDAIANGRTFEQFRESLVP